MRQMLNEIDEDQRAEAASDTPTGDPAYGLLRRPAAKDEPASITVPFPAAGESVAVPLVTAGEQDQSGASYGVESLRRAASDYESMSYHQWVKAKTRQYAEALSCRSTEDFIDLDRLNTVMSEYGAMYVEITRERRVLKDLAEQAKSNFDLWWDGKVEEASALAASEKRKITSDTGLQRYARSQFSDDYASRKRVSDDARRKAEFLGSIKEVVKDTGAVLRSLAMSIQFEWGTSGGLTVTEGQTQFRGVPARSPGERPAPDSIIRARRAQQQHQEQRTNG